MSLATAGGTSIGGTAGSSASTGATSSLGSAAIVAAILEDIGKQAGGLASLNQQQTAGKEQFSLLKNEAQNRFDTSKLAQDRQSELTDRQIGLQEQGIASQREASGNQIQDAKQSFKDESRASQRGLQGLRSDARTRSNQRKITRWGL